MAATKSISVTTGGSNNATVTAAEINGMATDFLTPGVVGAIGNTSGVSPSTGAFATNAQGTPNMTVRVTGGVLYASATPSGSTLQNLRVSFNTFEDVTIPANATGGTRYDWIYVAINQTTLANPGVNKDDVVTLATSRSTLSTSDNGTPPTAGYCIAVVTVTNGAASITNGNIADKRSIAPWTGNTNLGLSYNPYKFSAYANTTIAISSAAQKVVLNTELYDTGSNFDNATNYRFTAPIAGFYLFTGQATFGSAGMGTTESGQAVIYKNGAGFRTSQWQNGSGTASLIAKGVVTALVQLAAGDYIELYVQMGGVYRDIVGGSGTTYLEGCLISTT